MDIEFQNAAFFSTFSIRKYRNGWERRTYEIVIEQLWRLFRATCSPPRLLGLISLVSSFELIYERPALRFYFDDLKQIIAVSLILFYISDIAAFFEPHETRCRVSQREREKKHVFFSSLENTHYLVYAVNRAMRKRFKSVSYSIVPLSRANYLCVTSISVYLIFEIYHNQFAQQSFLPLPEFLLSLFWPRIPETLSSVISLFSWSILWKILIFFLNLELF